MGMVTVAVHTTVIQQVHVHTREGRAPLAGKSADLPGDKSQKHRSVYRR